MRAEDIINQVGQPVKLDILLTYYKNIVKENLSPENEYENSLRHYSLKELKKLEEILDEKEDNKGTTSL